MDHGRSVDEYLARQGRASAAQIIRAFELAFAAIWERAHRTLGHVTLTAIVDRVLHNAARRYPLLSTLALEESGLRVEGLRQRSASVDSAELKQAIRFTLVELLRVLGSLTAQVMTPALHAELAKLAPEPGPSSASGSERPATTKGVA